MVFQDGRLFPHRSVRGNLRYAHDAARGGPAFDDVVALLGLGALLARDVALQREVLASSASNQLAGVVHRVLARDGPYCAVEIDLADHHGAGERLWALVTSRSAHMLGLAPGQACVASFKAVAVEGRSIALRWRAAPRRAHRLRHTGAWPTRASSPSTWAARGR